MVSPKEAFTSVRWMPIAYAARAARAGTRQRIVCFNVILKSAYRNTSKLHSVETLGA
jgi:hypothetical protein